MSVFNGRASDIEDNRNKVSTIDENSTDTQYPSAKAVYDAMQSVIVDYSLVANALKGSASGSTVVLRDVSPVEHEMSVQLSETADVKVLGKNLIPYPYADLELGTSTYNGVDFTVYEDGSILINGTATGNISKSLFQNTTDLLGLRSGITISSNKNASDNTQQANISLMCNYYDSTGTMKQGLVATSAEGDTETITDNWIGLRVYLYIASGKAFNNLLIKPQIAIGDTADGYEPYIEPTEYTSNADGTVDGVTSIYPTTTIMTDTDGVIIDVKYNRDINKLHAELQETVDTEISGLKSNIQNTPKFVTVNPSVFVQEPYNNYIGNLGLNTISNIMPSHNAIDYPLGESGYYTVMTYGDTLSPIQIAVRLDGKIFARKKSTSGWKNWNADAVNFSNTLLTNTAKYSDFNDFPIGSIIGVSESARLNNAPDGFNNTGHVGMDVGGVIVNVMTFATSYDNPYIKSQIAVYYRQTGKPRIAFRSAIYFSSAYHWSEWSMLSQDGSITSTNKIVDINHLDYTFDDFNDAPLNTIYQVDLNVANSVANNPSPGHSGSLMTYCFSNSVRHAVVQEFVTIEDKRVRKYIRYGYINSGNVVSWTDWEKIVTERQTTTTD